MKIFVLTSLLMLTSCLGNKSDYSIVKPINKKFHAIIMIKTVNQKFKNPLLKPLNRSGYCSAFVIDDTTAITAGHCMNAAENTIERAKKVDLPFVKKQLRSLISRLKDISENCMGFQCGMFKAETRDAIEQHLQQIKAIAEVKPDKLEVFTIDGKNTKTIATALYKHDSRDYGFIKGDFKSFNKLSTVKDFPVQSGELLKACGYPGGKFPAVCVDFIALRPMGFVYAGQAMFVPGISGSPILNHNGLVVGIATAAGPNYAIMEPLLGATMLKK